MTVHLHLGVIDMPYNEAPAPPKRVAKAKQGKQQPRGAKPSAGGQTTGSVAKMLEAKYHVMETFFELNEQAIVDDLTDSLAGALEDLVAGAPPRDPFADATGMVEKRFHTFLESKAMDATGTPGVPTAAARRGVNHRLKIKRGLPRPSFIDTGLYSNSFKAWTETV